MRDDFGCPVLIGLDGSAMGPRELAVGRATEDTAPSSEVRREATEL
jgi:hypothetical protein